MKMCYPRNATADTSEEILEAVGRIQVRTIARRDNATTDALFDVAMGDQLAWTLCSLKTLTRSLEACKLKVRDWLLLA